jgi:hypothetical protein
VADNALLSSVTEPDEIRFRQAVIGNCLGNPLLEKELWSVAVDAITQEKQLHR